MTIDAPTSTTNKTTRRLRLILSTMLLAVSGFWIGFLLARMTREQDQHTATGNTIVMVVYNVLLCVMISLLTPIPMIAILAGVISLGFLANYVFAINIKLLNESALDVRVRLECRGNTVGPLEVPSQARKVMSFMNDEDETGRLVVESVDGPSVDLDIPMERFQREQRILRIVDAGGGLALVLS